MYDDIDESQLCPGRLTIQTKNRPVTLFCQADVGHAGNHRHLTKAGTARVWRDTPSGDGHLLEIIKVDRWLLAKAQT